VTLFVEKRWDQFGNRGFGYAVVEGELTEDKRSIIVIAPAEMLRQSPLIARHFQKVSAEAGPARMITAYADGKIKEMDELLEKYSI
jgi:hypothetical protein